MYLERGKYGGHYKRSGEQAHSLASFLILMVSDEPGSVTQQKPLGKRTSIRAVIRKVALHQLGHFMMGSARIGKNKYTLTGTYGDSGLPLSVKYEDWARGVPMPADLEEKFWKGGGHNSAGSEGPDVHAWGESLLAQGKGR